MADDRFLRVRAEVDSKDVPHICIGQAAAVSSEAFTGVSLRAEVVQLSPVMTRATLRRAERVTNSEAEAREVILKVLDTTKPQWPLGLQIEVNLQKC